MLLQTGIRVSSFVAGESRGATTAAFFSFGTIQWTWIGFILLYIDVQKGGNAEGQTADTRTC